MKPWRAPGGRPTGRETAMLAAIGARADHLSLEAERLMLAGDCPRALALLVDAAAVLGEACCDPRAA